MSHIADTIPPRSLTYSFVISIFGIIILSILGIAFKNNHEEFVGGIEDPEDGPAVASTIFVAVFVYIVSAYLLTLEYDPVLLGCKRIVG